MTDERPHHDAGVTAEEATAPPEPPAEPDTVSAAAATEEGSQAASGATATPAQPAPAPAAAGEAVADAETRSVAPAQGTEAAAAPEVADAAAGAAPMDAPATPAPATEAAPATQPAGEATGAVSPAPPPTVERTIAQEVARQLHAVGARYCFTVPAEPILPLLDALAAEGVRIVSARHEGNAAFMAEALAQSTGRPQIVAASRAVGASNAAIGIHTASQDSAPLVALIGQVSTAVAGREAFQEANVVDSVGALASWAAQIDAPADTVGVLGRAWRRLTTGRPGPVVLSIPVDLQTAAIELPDGPPPKAPGARGPAADRGAVSRALKLLAASERGVIVAGAGVSRARATKRLVALSEAMAVPVIAAWRRPDVFPNDHANYLGMAGSWSAPTVHQRLADADVIMFVGTRLSEISTDGYRIPGPSTRWIHVDVEPRTAAAGLSAPSLALAADASRFLDTAWSDLRSAALDNEMRSRREARNAADREAWKAAATVGKGTWEGPGVHPGKLFDVLRSALPDNAIITTDAGVLAAFVSRGFRFRRAGTFIGATSGTMGFGLPAAIAASLMDPDRITVALCGDGGFAMSLAELETAVRTGAHPIAIVLDNERYGTTAARQAVDQEPSMSDLGPIDFAAVAQAHGALGATVERDPEFEPALREAITSRRPSVIHVKVDRSWRSVDDTPVAIS